MDDNQFDVMARSLATTRASRRDTVRRLLAVGGASLATLIGIGGRVAARSVATGFGDATCRAAASNQVISKNACAVTRCGTAGCVCVVTVGHIRRCVLASDLVVPDTAGCPADDECDAKEDCPPRHVCAKVQKCCDGVPYNKCVRACTG